MPRWVASIRGLENPPGIRKVCQKSPKRKRTLLSEGSRRILRPVVAHIPWRFRRDSCHWLFTCYVKKLTRKSSLLQFIDFWNSQILNHILHWASNFKINNRTYHTDICLRIFTFHLFWQLSLFTRWIFTRILSLQISFGKKNLSRMIVIRSQCGTSLLAHF